MSNTSFLEELKRRNVYKVGIAYGIAAWLLLQVIDVVVPLMDIPEWIPKFVLLLLGIGFPIALIFAWAFEMTPEGLKREKDVDRTESITQETGQRLNRMIIGVLVIAVGILLVDKFFLGEPTIESSTEVTAIDEALVADATPSIAVLPFANMSADESSTYFSDGLADTLLHMLAQIREIRVAARTSSFQFRDQNTDIKEIANTLGVGTILEGSVQRAGNKVRVTAQLIEADTGFHLWSGNYDRDLDDIFAIQDEIANEVVAALKISLLGESAERLAHRETESIEAYTEYLLGIDDLAEYSFESLRKAEAHFREAVRLDPDYALAWARLGDTYLQIEDTGAGAFSETIENARDAATKALEIDDKLSSALAVLGAAERRADNTELAEQLLVRAIDAGPNDITAKKYYSRLLWTQLRVDESMAQIDEVLALDPLAADAHSRRSVGFWVLGDYDKGIEQAKKIVEINPDSPVGYYREAEILYTRGDWAKAIIISMQALEVDPGDPELAMLLGDYYIALELPNDAQRWYDRATEIDATHAVSRASPLIMHLYNNDIERASQLARQLLEEGIEDRQGSKALILDAIWQDTMASGQYSETLDYLEDYFAELFEENVEWRFDRGYHMIAIGSMMVAADDVRGQALLNTIVERADLTDEIFGPGLGRVFARSGLGDKDDALQAFHAVMQDRFSPEIWPVRVRNAPRFQLLRNEPEYIEWLESLEQNAAEQRVLLAELLNEQ